MDMQMRDTLTGVRSAVDYDAIAALICLEVACHLCRGQDQLAEEILIRLVSLSKSRDDAFRHNQDMQRRLRVDVLESDHVIIFENDFRWNFPCDDFLEECHRIEQLNSAISPPLQIFSRMKQVTSSRSASQARVQILTPRKCLIAGCKPKK